jgi:hypothetical protein
MARGYRARMRAQWVIVAIAIVIIGVIAWRTSAGRRRGGE